MQQKLEILYPEDIKLAFEFHLFQLGINEVERQKKLETTSIQEMLIKIEILESDVVLSYEMMFDDSVYVICDNPHGFVDPERVKVYWKRVGRPF